MNFTTKPQYSNDTSKGFKKIQNKIKQIDKIRKQSPFLLSYPHVNPEVYPGTDPTTKRHTQSACHPQTLSLVPAISTGHQSKPSSPSYEPPSLSYLLCFRVALRKVTEISKIQA